MYPAVPPFAPTCSEPEVWIAGDWGSEHCLVSTKTGARTSGAAVPGRQPSDQLSKQMEKVIRNIIFPYNACTIRHDTSYKEKMETL
jgi:hypothetical protein